MKKGIRTVSLILALFLLFTAVPAIFAAGEDSAEPADTPAVEPTDMPTLVPTETSDEEPAAPQAEAPEMPIGEAVHRYAVTNVGELKFRATPGTTKKDKVLEYLNKKGVYVWVLWTEENEAGETWSMVDYNGRTGYIMTKYLNLLTEEDSEAYNSAQESPAPVYTLEELFPTEMPTPEATLTPTPEPTEPPTPEPTAAPTPEPTEAPVIEEGEMINRYALTNAGELKLRASPGTTGKGKVLEIIEKRGTHVWLIRADQNEAGESWSYVRYKGRTGYIMTKYLNLLTREDSDAYNSAQASPAPVVSPEELLPTEEPTAVPTEMPTEEPTATPAVEPTPEPTAAPTPEPTVEPPAALSNVDLKVTAAFDKDILTYIPDVVSLEVSIKNDGDTEVRDVQVLSDETVLFTVGSLAAGEVVSLKKDVLISMDGTYIFTVSCKDASGKEHLFSGPAVSVTVRSSDI